MLPVFAISKIVRTIRSASSVLTTMSICVLGKRSRQVLAASVDLRNALLPALAFDVGNRHSRAELSHRVLYGIKFFPSYDCCDSFHTFTSVLFLKLPAHVNVVRGHTSGPGHGQLLLFRSFLRSSEPVAAIVPSYSHFWDVEAVYFGLRSDPQSNNFVYECEDRK